LAAETNWPKITAIFSGSRQKQTTFGGLVWPEKIKATFGGNFPQFLAVFLWRPQKIKNRQK
jgi:hypothetical protein